MSTPTTAVATLPPYHHFQHNSHSHNHNHNHSYDHARSPYSHSHAHAQYYQANPSPSTTPSSLVPNLSTSSRTESGYPAPPANDGVTHAVPRPHNQTQTQTQDQNHNDDHNGNGNDFHLADQSHNHHTDNGRTLRPSQPHRSPYHHHYSQHLSPNESHAHGHTHGHDAGHVQSTATANAPRHAPADTMANGLPPMDPHSRKRRRSRGPDWDSFYRNGLPKEVIVIDDSPDPEANTSRRVTNGTSTHVVPPTIPDATDSQYPAKKRKREANGKPAAQAQAQYATNHNTPLQVSAGSSSTISSDGNSALHTTAATSLSSNGHEEQPAKRKRTRQQVAIEAKRRDVDGFGEALFTYKPPPYPPKKAADVHVRVVRDPHHNRNIKVDDEDGHYIVVPEADLTDKYRISRLLGQGTFGKVVQAKDRKRNKLVAVKIIRSVQKYRDASRIELRVLATLKANDPENRNRCIHLVDTFDYRGHICIVMELLDQSVFDFLKGNGFVPFPNSQIQNFARQLFTSMAFLHDLNLIHTDLKPENILLCHNGYQTFTYNRKIPSSSSTVSRHATQRRVLLDTEIRLIDFGSATFEDEYHSSVVSTRHYRAPEIILGLGWSYPCDIWSIGCILVEFFTGDALFQTHDNLEHLAMMEAVIGSRIDSHLVQDVNRMSLRNVSAASKYFKRLKLDYPNSDTTRGSRRFVKAMKHLEDIIPANTGFLTNFLDLLRRIFVYDPKQRITAKQALNHPWFKEMAQPDDGTEAAKIRLQRRRLELEGRQS